MNELLEKIGIEQQLGVAHVVSTLNQMQVEFKCKKISDFFDTLLI
jgi:hypothetical protein